MTNWNEPIVFFARSEQSIGRLAPIYLALDSFWRGDFLVPEKLVDFARGFGLVEAVGLHGSVNRPLEVTPPMGSAPTMTCNYRDLLAISRGNLRRSNIYLQAEDGFVGEAQKKVSLFLCGSEGIKGMLEKRFPNRSYEVVEDGAGRGDPAPTAIEEFMREHSTIRRVHEMNGESIGIVYMAFGAKAAKAVQASVLSLRKIGLDIPVCVIGSTPVPGLQFVEWTGESPFDAGQRINFQFRAGRVKPGLYPLSPFERTLYIDADTEFMQDILPGFEALSDCDVAIARENLTLGQLYNKAQAGWEINIIERDATMKELNAGPNVHFLNSGVVFFRKSAAVELAMRRWHEAWLEWQQWDEQLAFMRAFYRTPEAKVKVLEPEWNFPHRMKGAIIFHNYGRGVVRMNAPIALRVLPPNSESANLGEETAVFA